MFSGYERSRFVHKGIERSITHTIYLKNDFDKQYTHQPDFSTASIRHTYSTILHVKIYSTASQLIMSYKIKP